VRDRNHWNTANNKLAVPVTLGLVGDVELDAVVRSAGDKKANDDARKGIVSDGPALSPAGETAQAEPEPVYEDEDERGDDVDLNNVFANSGPAADYDDEDED
jgi:hypothetical protein